MNHQFLFYLMSPFKYLKINFLTVIIIIVIVDFKVGFRIHCYSFMCLWYLSIHFIIIWGIIVSFKAKSEFLLGVKFEYFNYWNQFLSFPNY